MIIRTLVIPKTIGSAVDLYYKIREERLLKEEDTKEMKKQEAELADYICKQMPKTGTTGVRGKLANFTTEPVTVPTAKDWDATWAYIKKNNAFFLLQKRLNDKAVREVWDAGKTIPGIEKFDTVKFHCTKI